MSATLEVKYYNSFWLKKIKTITDVTSGATAIFASQANAVITITVAKTITELNVGQEVSWLDTGVKKIAYIIAIASPTGTNTVFTINGGTGSGAAPTIPAGATLTFGPIKSF